MIAAIPLAPSSLTTHVQVKLPVAPCVLMTEAVDNVPAPATDAVKTTKLRVYEQPPHLPVTNPKGGALLHPSRRVMAIIPPTQLHSG